jgi:hypothetical protein
MNDILSPLSGRPREVMEAILRNVDTENLEQGYKTFIGRVLREASDDNAGGTKTQQKEDKVLAEGEKKDKKDVLKEGVAVTGDQEGDVIEEGATTGEGDRQKLEHLRRLAGIN